MSVRTTVVLGDDGTTSGDAAWAWIAAQRWPGWRLEVVHAAEAPGATPPPDQARLHPWEPPRPRLPDAGAGFAEVLHLVACLDPRLALTQPTDLLVVGPRGPALPRALHLGSTAEWLLQHPPSPVVIARHGGPVRRVLACADGSPHARRALRALAGLPWIEGVDVLVLTVDDGKVEPETALAEATALLDAAGAVTSTLLARGRPAGAILDASEDHAVDLVAMGTRGLSALRRMRVGSTAGSVARGARCTMLLACEDPEEL